jgi:hypothetical protein
MNNLETWEASLGQVFAEIAGRRRGGTVFLIEHGLDREDLEQLQYLVAQRAERHQFTGHAWRRYALCLCTIVTECGYEYRGAGTDFWPKLEASLRVEIPVPQRGEISDLFGVAADEFGLARPPADRWSAAFPHIAWPIRNAMVPREVHGRLARLIREFLGQSSTMTVRRESLPALRELAQGFGSRRLDSWLLDEDLAVAVIGYLVNGRVPESAMEPDFMRRLHADLRSETEVRRLEQLVTARRLSGLDQSRPLPAATFELLLDDADANGLALRGPVLSRVEMESLKAELGEPLSAQTVVAGARSTTLERFLQGDAIFIGRPLGKVPEPRLNGREMPPRLKRAIVPAPGLLFRDQGDHGYQPQLRPTDRVGPGTSFYEMRCEEASADDWGAGLYHFHSGTEKGNAILARYGIYVQVDPPLEFRGGLTLFHDGDAVAQVEGRVIELRTRAACTIRADRMDEAEVLEFTLCADAWTPLPMTKGEWSLAAFSGSKEASAKLSFRALEPREAATLSLQPTGAGLAEFARGAVSIHLGAPIALHDVRLDIELTSGSGQRISMSLDIPTAPATIGCDTDGFGPMRDVARLWASGGLHARLHVEAQGLDAALWPLAAPEPEWKLDRRSGMWVADGTRTAKSLACDPEHDPTRLTEWRPCDDPGEEPPACLLLRPDGAGDDALSSGIILEPDAGARLRGQFRAASPTILRISASTEEACGLQAGLEALLSWSLASSQSAFAEGLRAGVCAELEREVVRALCGSDWVRAERCCQEIGAAFHARLVAVATEAGLVSGEPLFSPLSEAWDGALRQELEAAFRKALPNPELAVIPEDLMWPDLDDAVLDAWERLAKRMAVEGEPEPDFDAGCSNGEWQAAVVKARDAARLPKLSSLLLPRPRSASLERLAWQDLQIDDVVAALVECHSDIQMRGGRWIAPADLKALLLLFVAPARVLDDPDWRGRLLRFGSDRATARAVRYAALRLRALRTASNA